MLGVFLNIAGATAVNPGPALTWESWDGSTWGELAVEDEAAQLTQRGMINFVGPDAADALARFDAPLYWVRGRLRT